MNLHPLVFRRPAATTIVAAFFLLFLFGPPYVVQAADVPIAELME